MLLFFLFMLAYVDADTGLYTFDVCMRAFDVWLAVALLADSLSHHQPSSFSINANDEGLRIQ